VDVYSRSTGDVSRWRPGVGLAVARGVVSAGLLAPLVSSPPRSCSRRSCWSNCDWLRRRALHARGAMRQSRVNCSCSAWPSLLRPAARRGVSRCRTFVRAKWLHPSRCPCLLVSALLDALVPLRPLGLYLRCLDFTNPGGIHVAGRITSPHSFSIRFNLRAHAQAWAWRETSPTQFNPFGRPYLLAAEPGRVVPYYGLKTDLGVTCRVAAAATWFGPLRVMP